MNGSIAHLEKKNFEYSKGKVMMLGSVLDYYGSATPLSQVPQNKCPMLEHYKHYSRLKKTYVNH
jgi:hypothetical protein